MIKTTMIKTSQTSGGTVAQDRCREYMLRVARIGAIGIYGAINRLIGHRQWLGNYSMKQCAEMCGQISFDEVAAGGPMLSAVIVSMSGKTRGRPGRGFYTLARKLGLLRPGMDRERFWRDEVRKVRAYALQLHRAQRGQPPSGASSP